MKRPVLSYFSHVRDLLLLWEVSPLRFPLDEKMNHARDGHLADLKRLLHLAVQVGQVHRRYYDDTIDSYLELAEFRTDEDVHLFLLPFSDESDLVYAKRDLSLFRLPLNDRVAFIRKTTPIFRRLLHDFLSFALLARAESYNEGPALQLIPPFAPLIEMLAIVHKLSPSDINLPPPAQVLADFLVHWVASMSGHCWPGLDRVITELREDWGHAQCNGDTAISAPHPP